MCCGGLPLGSKCRTELTQPTSIGHFLHRKQPYRRWPELAIQQGLSLTFYERFRFPRRPRWTCLPAHARRWRQALLVPASVKKLGDEKSFCANNFVSSLLLSKEYWSL